MNIVKLIDQAGSYMSVINGNTCFTYEQLQKFVDIVRAEALAEPVKQEPEVCQFPRQSNNEGGWTIEAKFLNALVKDMADDEFAVGMEETEAVLLALERIHAAPVSAEAIREGAEMNKTTEALKLAEEALEGWKEYDTWTDQQMWNDDDEEALVAIREALADHSGDANEMVMDWSKVKPEAIKSDPMYQMGYAAAKADPVKQGPVAFVTQKLMPGFGLRKDVVFVQQVEVGADLYAAPVSVEACKECGTKQARIDRLMLEYCPDEMTPEQMHEWSKNQKPVQEPVAVVEITYGREPECYVTGNIDDFPEGAFKLYTKPVEWVDLTDDEIDDAYTSDAHENTPKSFARAVIASFKEKNT